MGSTVVCVAAAMLLMCQSSVVFPGVGRVVMHVQVPPLVAVVLVSLCSWCCHGSSLLFDDARCLPNLLIVSDSHGGALSQGSCCQSLVVVAPKLCREVRYARQCGALGCLISLGIVIPRRQRLLVPPMGSSIGMLARLGFVLGVLFSSFIIFLLVWFSALFSS